MQQDPQSFIQQPGGFTPPPAYQPRPTPPSQTQEPRVPYVPRRAACLTVLRDDEQVLLNAEAARLLPATVTRAELQHPVRQRDKWQLSTQAEARCHLSPAGQGRLRFRAPLACRALFASIPAGTDVLQFELERVAPGLFRLCPLTVTK